MASRRAPIRKGSVNYGNFSSNDFGNQTKLKGTKPTAPRATIMDVLIDMAVDIGKMYLMLKIQYRIAVYLGVLFGVSIIGDVLPYPKSYFSQSSHFLNQYFVKLGWGWTLISTIPFVVMTSYTYCCSDRKQVGFHLLRLGVATFFWLFWTNMFQYIESIYGRCGDTKFTTRSKCLNAGSRWSGFDISGHSFLLIYSVLIMIEESKPIQGWPSEYIRMGSGFDISGHSFLLIYSVLIMIEESKPLQGWPSEYIRMGSGFDISGHSFLLIYSVLIMIEESKPIQGWPRKNSVRIFRSARDLNPQPPGL
ncbi:hypothetical protein WDU94_003149 [Cyamophila willieti]